MKRREALKSLSAAACSTSLFRNGALASISAVATSERKLVIFVDESVMPAAALADSLTGKLPIDPVIVPVRVPQGLSIKDVILIGESD